MTEIYSENWKKLTFWRLDPCLHLQVKKHLFFITKHNDHFCCMILRGDDDKAIYNNFSIYTLHGSQNYLEISNVLEPKNACSYYLYRMITMSYIEHIFNARLSTAQQKVLSVIQQQQCCPLSSEQFGNKKYSLQHDTEFKKKINKTGHFELPS
jgi:hypothetical protein